MTDYSYTPIYTLKGSECDGNTNTSRGVRIDRALEAYDGNFLDKITATAQSSMAYALERIEARITPVAEED